MSTNRDKTKSEISQGEKAQVNGFLLWYSTRESLTQPHFLYALTNICVCYTYMYTIYLAFIRLLFYSCWIFQVKNLTFIIDTRGWGGVRRGHRWGVRESLSRRDNKQHITFNWMLRLLLVACRHDDNNKSNNNWENISWPRLHGGGGFCVCRARA